MTEAIDRADARDGTTFYENIPPEDTSMSDVQLYRLERRG
jgi:hypothetical protein